MPIFSLPGKYGIGCFSDAAYRFVDFLADAGQTYWQILPVGPTGYGDSPYQSFSTFAGNPYFIDPDQLIRQGYLSEADTRCLEEGSDDKVDYGFQYRNRYAVLKQAYETWKKKPSDDFSSYKETNNFWLEDYCLFMALKDAFGGRSFRDWEDDIRFRKPEALAFWKEKLADQMGFYAFLQYEFTKEWHALKDYANEQGIRIIGDIPIYVSPDSADFWANPKLFQVDEENNPVAVAGCPPDGFAADGQLWGNPLYNWEAQKEEGFTWWIDRIRKCSEFYDVLRIDHFRGFDEYFSIRAGEKTARDGSWKKGPGMDLFKQIRRELGDIPIIAEDLGYITDSVRQLVRDTGFPNMKILEFAFDSRDSSGRQNYLPHNYNKNCVVYTGTHDNETLVGWLGNILPSERKELAEYLDTDSQEEQVLVDKCIKLAEASVADYCIIPMQDWLGLGNEARINHPSTLGSNWTWRMNESVLSKDLSDRMLRILSIYGRLKY